MRVFREPYENVKEALSRVYDRCIGRKEIKTEHFDSPSLHLTLSIAKKVLSQKTSKKRKHIYKKTSGESRNKSQRKYTKNLMNWRIRSNKIAFLVTCLLLSTLVAATFGFISSHIGSDGSKTSSHAAISSGISNMKEFVSREGVRHQTENYKKGQSTHNKRTKAPTADDSGISYKMIHPESSRTKKDQNRIASADIQQFESSSQAVDKDRHHNQAHSTYQNASLRSPVPPSEHTHFQKSKMTVRDNRKQIIARRARSNLEKIQLILRESETLNTNIPYATALISDDSIADVVPLSDRMIYILGKKVGNARLTILDKDKKITNLIEIEVTYNLAKMQKEINELLPKAKINVKSINGNVMLTGQAPDVINLKNALTFAERYTSSKVTNAVKITSPQQVMLEVRFLEANREAIKEIGIHWNVLANKFIGATLLSSPTSSISKISNIASGLTSGKVPFGSAVASLLNNGTSIDLVIQALENRNVARRLAEPNLVAISGERASFLAGGEFPFSVVGANQTVGTQFKRFGVSLEFTPTVLENGLINLKIVPEVSEIAPSIVKLANGASAPSLLMRRVRTTVELRDGQSFAIAGLLQSTDYKIRNQLPWLGDIPILGALFRSSSFQRKETDLVIIITPRLVKPAIPTQKLATPLDETMASNDIQFFLGGKDEVNKTKRSLDRKVGHILVNKNDSQTEKKKQGNAVSTNNAIQTINPWPDYAGDTDFSFDGNKSLKTMERKKDSSAPGDEIKTMQQNQGDN